MRRAGTAAGRHSGQNLSEAEPLAVGAAECHSPSIKPRSKRAVSRSGAHTAELPRLPAGGGPAPAAGGGRGARGAMLLALSNCAIQYLRLGRLQDGLLNTPAAATAPTCIAHHPAAQPLLPAVPPPALHSFTDAWTASWLLTRCIHTGESKQSKKKRPSTVC